MAAYRIRECGWFANERQNKADGADSLPVRGQRHASDGLPRAFRLLLIRDVRASGRLHYTFTNTHTMTNRIKTTLEGLINVIDGCTAGQERPTLLNVKERINTILEEAEAFDASALSAIKENLDLKATQSKPSPDTPSNTPEMHGDAIRLLVALFNESGYVPLPAVLDHLGISNGFLEVHIKSLGRFVDRNNQSSLAIPGVPDGIRITDEGRSFLTAHHSDKLV